MTESPWNNIQENKVLDGNYFTSTSQLVGQALLEADWAAPDIAELRKLELEKEQKYVLGERSTHRVLLGSFFSFHTCSDTWGGVPRSCFQLQLLLLCVHHVRHCYSTHSHTWKLSHIQGWRRERGDLDQTFYITRMTQRKVAEVLQKEVWGSTREREISPRARWQGMGLWRKWCLARTFRFHSVHVCWVHTKPPACLGPQIQVPAQPVSGHGAFGSCSALPQASVFSSAKRV